MRISTPAAGTIVLAMVTSVVAAPRPLKEVKVDELICRENIGNPSNKHAICRKLGGAPRSEMHIGCHQLLEREKTIAKDLNYVYLGVLPLFEANCGLVVTTPSDENVALKKDVFLDWAEKAVSLCLSDDTVDANGIVCSTDHLTINLGSEM